MMQPVPGIPLADLIDAVRFEIEKSRYRAQQRNLQFEVTGVKLEVELTATGTAGVEGGIKLWAISLGGTASRSDEATHRVTLDLVTSDPSGSKVRVSDSVDKPVSEG